MNLTRSGARPWGFDHRAHNLEVTSGRPPSMIYPAICMPGRFSAWCEALLAELVTASAGAPVVISVSELEQLGREVLARDLGPALVVSRQPDRKICDALTGEGKKPFLFVVDDPQLAVAELMLDHGLDFLQAVKTVAGSCATMLPLVDAPNGLSLGRGEPAHRGSKAATGWPAISAFRSTIRRSQGLPPCRS